MNWLTSFARQKIKPLLGAKDTPDNLWTKCSNCGEMIFHRDLVSAQMVCTNCNHHMRLGPTERFDALFDNQSYDIIETPEVPNDPLKFRDEKRYTERLKDARNKTAQRDAFTIAFGQMDGLTTVAGVQNFKFMGGSLGMAAGEALIRSAELAIEKKAPLILFTAAGGARMQEGIMSLMQMPRTTIAVQMMRDEGLPYIVVLTDPTTGGVTASYAMLGDVQISEPGALICFAGPRVIEQTIREKLPEGFQRAEYLLEHGMLDMVVHRHELRETLSRTAHLLMNQTPSPMPQTTDEEDAQSDPSQNDGDKAPVEAAPTTTEEVKPAPEDPLKEVERKTKLAGETP